MLSSNFFYCKTCLFALTVSLAWDSVNNEEIMAEKMNDWVKGKMNRIKKKVVLGPG